MYGWTNEDGEPIMDGAAWRFEQELDRQSAEESYAERWLDDDDDYDEPEHDDEDSEPWEPEDGWLDGSYEE